MKSGKLKKKQPLKNKLEVKIAADSGFCFGVKRAMEMAYRYAGENGPAVYSYHEIIHNPQEVKRLEEAGAKHTDSIARIKGGSRAIISTHGVTPEEEKKLKEKCAGVLDTTCPYVKRIHRIVDKLKKENYSIVIAGDRDHPEVKGILGYAGSGAVVVSDENDIKNIKPGVKTGIVAQTTKNKGRFALLVCAAVERIFEERNAEIRVFNTICDATRNRQEAAVKLAKESDVMIVMGGRNSANTVRLYELCGEILKDVYHVESPQEIKKEWFKGKRRAGICAGASTPQRLIEEAADLIKSF